jgi:hypothetical protein
MAFPGRVAPAFSLAAARGRAPEHEFVKINLKDFLKIILIRCRII